jgi:hypothetical protein
MTGARVSELSLASDITGCPVTTLSPGTRWPGAIPPLNPGMGRKPLFKERENPLYFKISPPRGPVAAGQGAAEDAQANRHPEWFMEQVMEGLSDACMLVDGTSRLLYVNSAAKSLLSSKGRILGRKLDAVLAHRQLSMLVADVYHTGKPVFSKLHLSMPGDRWRLDHTFHVSIIPLWISPVRRLVRIALRDALPEKPAAGTGDTAARLQEQDEPPGPPPSPQCNDAMNRMRTPLTILQGYLENLLDGAIKDPIHMRQALLTMRKHSMAIEKLMDACGK